MGIRERRVRDRERRRQQIIVAAKRVFSAWGYNKATMEEIAREAELSPGTLYLYFKNKDELYASLTTRVLQFLSIRLEHIDNEETLDPPQYVEALKQALNDVYDFDPSSLMNMFCMQSSEILGNLSPQLLNEINSLSQNSQDLMARIFRRGAERGAFIESNPEDLAVVVWSLFSGTILWEEFKAIVYGDKDTRTHSLETAFRIFSRGIAKNPGDLSRKEQGPKRICH